MDLILLSCSGSKLQGGTSIIDRSSKLTSYLSLKSKNKLFKLRQQIAEQIGETNGPDLGIIENNTSLKFLPANKRYVGKIYKASNFSINFHKTNGLYFLLVSAFYGVLDASDPTRYYQWKMENKLPIGNSTMTWWKNNGLGELLFEVVENLKPKIIYNFLFKKYRVAIDPFLNQFTKCGIQTFNTSPGYESMSTTGKTLLEVMRRYSYY